MLSLVCAVEQKLRSSTIFSSYRSKKTSLYQSMEAFPFGRSIEKQPKESTSAPPFLDIIRLCNTSDRYVSSTCRALSILPNSTRELRSVRSFSQRISPEDYRTDPSFRWHVVRVSSAWFSLRERTVSYSSWVGWPERRRRAARLNADLQVAAPTLKLCQF